MDHNESLPSIYAYNDFRKFLADYQAARMEIDPAFSKSEFSRMMDLPNTRSYLTDVLKGKRVTETFVERFVKVIGFTNDEAHFFRTLVRFNQAESIAERELAFEQLIDLNKTPSRTIDKKMFEYYSHWHYSVVRALLEIETFRDDYAALAKKVRPAITPGEARKAVTLLLELGLAEKNGEGVIKPADKAIKAPENYKTELLRQYQLQLFKLMEKKMVEMPADIGFSLMSTISVSDKGYDRLLRLMEKFQSQVRSLVHKDEDAAVRIVHLSANITNLTTGDRK